MQKLLSFIKTRPEVLALADHDQAAFLAAFGWQVSTPRKRGESAKINWDNSQFIDKAKAESQFKAATAGTPPPKPTRRGPSLPPPMPPCHMEPPHTYTDPSSVAAAPLV